MTNVQYISGGISAGECISNAWELLKRNYGMYLGIAVLAMILTGCVPCLNIFILGPVMGGVYYVALRDMRDEPVEFGMMFKGFEKFVPLMIIGLIQSIPGIIAQVIQYGVQIADVGMGGRRSGGFNFFQASTPDFALSGIVIVVALLVFVGFMVFAFLWWAVFFFAIPLVMEHDMGAGDAIKMSARAAMANIGGMLGYFVLLAGVMLLGMLLLCIGMFLISMPLMYIGGAFVYRQVFPLLQQDRGNMMPPPPNVYGSSFGTGLG
jgi:uncharacterized membrane protein